MGLSHNFDTGLLHLVADGTALRGGTKTRDGGPDPLVHLVGVGGQAGGDDPVGERHLLAQAQQGNVVVDISFVVDAVHSGQHILLIQQGTSATTTPSAPAGQHKDLVGTVVDGVGLASGYDPVQILGGSGHPTATVRSSSVFNLPHGNGKVHFHFVQLKTPEGGGRVGINHLGRRRLILLKHLGEAPPEGDGIV